MREPAERPFYSVTSPDADKAAYQYETEIRRIQPGACIPAFDLVLLGIGEDGHTASFFPGTEWDEERLVVASFVKKLKSHRISMTPRIVNESQTVIKLVSGFSKSKGLADVLKYPTGSFPTTRIRPVTGNLTWMVDRPAASLLFCDK